MSQNVYKRKIPQKHPRTLCPDRILPADPGALASPAPPPAKPSTPLKPLQPRKDQLRAYTNLFFDKRRWRRKRRLRYGDTFGAASRGARELTPSGRPQVQVVPRRGCQARTRLELPTLLSGWNSGDGASLLGEGPLSQGRDLVLRDWATYSWGRAAILAAVATTGTKEKYRQNHPGLSTRILPWSGCSTQRGAHTSKFGLEVGPGSSAWCAQRDRPEEQGFT